MSLSKPRLLSLLLLGMAVFYALGCDAPNDSASSTPSSSPTSPGASSNSSSSATHDLGYEGVLSVGGGNIPIGREEDDYKEIVDAAVAKDKEGIGKLLLEDKAFSVEDGVKVRLIKRNWTGGIRVRILSGNKAGEDGWTSMEFLK